MVTRGLRYAATFMGLLAVFSLTPPTISLSFILGLDCGLALALWAHRMG